MFNGTNSDRCSPLVDGCCNTINVKKGLFEIQHISVLAPQFSLTTFSSADPGRVMGVLFLTC